MRQLQAIEVSDISHAYREANSRANWLANKGREAASGFLIVSNISLELSVLLDTDMSGYGSCV